MKYCVQGNICPPFVFTPLAFIVRGELKTWRIPMSQIISESLQTQMFNGKFKVFASVKGPENYTEQNNSVYSILLTRRFFIAGFIRIQI